MHDVWWGWAVEDEDIHPEQATELLKGAIAWGEEHSYGLREKAWLTEAERALKLPPGSDIFDYYPELEMGAHPGH